MSSQPSDFKNFGSLRHQKQKHRASESQSNSLGLRFSHLSLDDLQEEINRRTRETQNLQDEVGKTSKLLLDKYGRIGNTTQTTHTGDSSGDATRLQTRRQAASQSSICPMDTLNEEAVQTNQNSSQTILLENVVNSCLKQLNELKLNKCDQTGQSTFHQDRGVVNPQTKPHEIQNGKEDFSDIRFKNSRDDVDPVDQMLLRLEEYRKIKGSAERSLQETKHEEMALEKKVDLLEKAVKEMHLLFSEGQCGDGYVSSDSANKQTQPSVTNEQVDHCNNRDYSKVSYQPEEQQGSNVWAGENQHERIDDLITSLGQEMATLSDKLSSSQSSGIDLCVKLELLKKLSARQTSLHQMQTSELEKTLNGYKEKVCIIEQQLAETQTDRNHSRLQAKELRDNLQVLKDICQQQQAEHREETEVLKGKLDVSREENVHLRGILDRKLLEDGKLLELLQEKDAELCVRQQEIHKHLSRLEEARSQFRTLRAEHDALRLKLEDSEKTIEVLKLQMETSVQMTVQHGHTVGSLHQENNLLLNQLNQYKRDIQQLRSDLAQHKSDFAVAEREKRQLQASVAEQRQRVREESQEKQDLITQLEFQRAQLLTLTKEHKDLLLLHSCKNEEHEGVVLKLQSQLRNANEELLKSGRTLRTLRGADEHGLKVALDMQKEVTARRELVDSLQVKIKQLEDNMDKLQQEKQNQDLQTHQQKQELAIITEEKRQLVNELKILHSKDQELKERVSELESILHKMSENFADCRDFLQHREQEYFRLKLQHALDLKELQGQNLRARPDEAPPDLGSWSAHAVPTSSQQRHHQIETKSQPPRLSPRSSPSSRNPEKPKQSSTEKLKFLLREQRGVISENHRPPSDKSSSPYRRRSNPDADKCRNTAFGNSDELKSGSRRRTCGSEPLYLKTSELNGNARNSPGSSAVNAGFHQQPSLDCRSPVHFLLTSNPKS